MIQKIEAWETSDGRVWRTEVVAQQHEAELDRLQAANTALKSGASVLACLKLLWLDPVDAPRAQKYDVLERVTKDTKIAIPHWQCSDKPGYQVSRFELGGRVYLFGDAGAWSGPYGSTVSVEELVRHVEETLRCQVWPKWLQNAPEGAKGA